MGQEFRKPRYSEVLAHPDVMDEAEKWRDVSVQLKLREIKWAAETDWLVTMRHGLCNSSPPEFFSTLHYRMDVNGPSQALYVAVAAQAAERTPNWQDKDRN